MPLTRRTSLLLDDDLRARLQYSAASRGISVSAVVREAISEKLGPVRDTSPHVDARARAEAIEELLAEPMPVEECPVMEREL